MFEKKMEFRMLFAKTNEALEHYTTLVHTFDVRTTELRSTEIRDENDKLKQEAYVLCCKGPVKAFEKLKEKYSVISYEGYPTLY